MIKKRQSALIGWLQQYNPADMKKCFKLINSHSTEIDEEELMREIRKNTGQRKVLVFSQFTEMMQLIKERMEQEVVQYAYLDGSTSAKNRKQAVDDFQNNAHIKVFLISLKAGGVGLNLTAADYIYLVDPWRLLL